MSSSQELIFHIKNAFLFLKTAQHHGYKAHCFNGKINGTSGADRISLQSSREQMRRQIGVAVKKQKPGQPAPTHPRGNEWLSWSH